MLPRPQCRQQPCNADIHLANVCIHSTAYTHPVARLDESITPSLQTLFFRKNSISRLRCYFFPPNSIPGIHYASRYIPPTTLSHPRGMNRKTQAEVELPCACYYSFRFGPGRSSYYRVKQGKVCPTLNSVRINTCVFLCCTLKSRQNHELVCTMPVFGGVAYCAAADVTVPAC